MSHFNVAVVLPEGQKFDEGVVLEMMAPYQERDEWFEDGTRWDWFVIGGRWDGAIRGLEWNTYLETCSLCGGSGKRPDMEISNGCNGCKGTGKSEAWTTDSRYRDPDRNVCKVSEVSPTYTPVAFVGPDGKWIEQTRMGFFGMSIPDEDGAEQIDKVSHFDQEWARVRAEMGDQVVVGLDCHV